MRVLCIDAESGLGGSSRSLFLALRSMDRSAVQAEVWCNHRTFLAEEYEKLGVPCRERRIPRCKYVERFWPNLYVLARSLALFVLRFREIAAMAREIRERFDLVHFNLDSSFLFLLYLRLVSDIPLVVHMRTTLFDHVFCRLQMVMLSRRVQGFIFITENEAADFARLGGTGPARVIYNGVEVPDGEVAAHPAMRDVPGCRVACIGNFSYVRGYDRVVELAEILARRGRRDIHFFLAGNMALSGDLPGELGEVRRRGGTLEDYARTHGVGHLVTFLGYVPRSETVLAGCQVLLKPTREANPWGRDILEALAMARPVVSIGTYDRFVAHGRTGLLYPEYDAEAVADGLCRLADDPGLAADLGRAGREVIRELCDPRARAADLLQVWRETAREGGS